MVARGDVIWPWKITLTLKWHWQKSNHCVYSRMPNISPSLNEMGFVVSETWLKVTQGHRQSHHSIDHVWNTKWDHSIVTHCNHVAILQRFSDIATFLPKFQVVTWPRPRLIWGQHVISWLVLAMVNMYTDLEVSSFTHAKDTKGGLKCQNRSFCGYGSLKGIGSITIW